MALDAEIQTHRTWKSFAFSVSNLQITVLILALQISIDVIVHS
jgi:hypothetical protein